MDKFKYIKTKIHDWDVLLTLKHDGTFIGADVDDGGGFPAPSNVVDYYCSICCRRLSSTGESWCAHKIAVMRALQHAYHDAPLPFDDASELYSRNTKRAIDTFNDAMIGTGAP